MALTWNSYNIADARLLRVHGQRLAGAYGLRLGVEFTVTNWMPEPPFPIVLFLPATVMVSADGHGSGGVVLGKAFPETPMPFIVSQYASGQRCLMFDIALSPEAMESIEDARSGQGLRFSVALQAEVRRGSETTIAHEQTTVSFTVSDWLQALEQCGYGRSMVFEIPMFESTTLDTPATRLLASARAHFLRGQYAQVVSECRLVLESLTKELCQGQQLEAAVTQHKVKRRDLTLEQRELILRQAAVDYAHPAHHIDSGLPVEMFDRRSAQMLLSMTATLVSAALNQQAAATRQA